MDRSYLNSVRVEEDRCTGCLLCVKKCLVQAIRVRDGKAVIISDRCIDCGECIRCCPTRAIAALVEPLEELKSYKVNIALATPSFYAQFDGNISASILWQGLKEIGFDSVFDVPLAGDYISEEIEAYLDSYEGSYPVISSACPAVLRLIQTKYPELICHVVPALAPAEAAAIYVRRETMKRLNLVPEDVGIWFLSPCPAKGTNIHQSVDVAHTAVTGSFTLASLYGPLSVVISEIRKEKNELPQALVGTSYELLWGTERGELLSTGCRHGLSVSGPEDVDEVLKQITLGSLTDVEYVSCYICDGGCVGGPSVAVNKFVGTKNLERRAMLRHEREREDRREAMQAARICENFPRSKDFIKSLQAKPAPPLDPDFGTAMEKMERLTALAERLLDCGACGAPTCRIFAEDVIRGFAKEEDCIIRSRQSRKK